MRILHAVHSLTSGGAERQLQLLCRWWSDPAIGHGVFCVSPAGNEIPADKARIFVARSADPRSRDYWRSLRAAIEEFDPHVVHAWLPASMTIPAMLLGALAGRRVVFSYRSRMRFHRPLSWPEFAVTLACADRIVSNNPIVDSHRAFRWLFRRKRGVVIRNAVAVPPGLARERPFPGPGGEWRFACVGRLTEAKNLHAVIAAAALLPAALRWRLDVYGEGELRESLLAAIAARGLGDRITLHGHSAEVYRRMVEADVLLMPSLWEGMPNVALESLALGVPLVISDIPPHRELLRGDGTVAWVRPDSPASIAEAMAGCAAGRYDLAGMARRGREWAAAFHPAGMVAAYRDFYASLRA
jgi:glycosyltransferase involved in cell wall biosynthesis